MNSLLFSRVNRYQQQMLVESQPSMNRKSIASENIVSESLAIVCHHAIFPTDCPN